MFISNSPAQTETVGAEFAAGVVVRDVIALIGDLGAGKTQFAKGFVRALGSDAEVTSPTFTLIHEYSGGHLPVYHFDFYRLDTREAVLQLGFDDYVEGDGVCIIEWADRFPDLLPPRATWITINSRSETDRVIEQR